MPKVSVIVPVYNVEKYIEKCLNSLVNQTLQDIEIIIVNDGSTDNSETIIKKYIQNNHENIKYVTKTNGGLSDARNYGMKYATGEYIAFLDSDDYVDVTIYEKMYNKAIEEKCDFVECDFVWKYDNKEVKDCGEIYHNKHEMLEKARVVAWNKLIKRELIEQTKIEFPKGLRYEDIEFFYKLLPHIKNFGFVKEYLIYYIQRGNSIANTQNEKTKDIFMVLENVINYYKDNNFYDEYEIELEYSYTRLLLCSSILRIIKIKDKKIKRELLKQTWSNLNSKFPNWKKNRILKINKNWKNRYMKCLNSFTYTLSCKILEIAFKTIK
ncbi:MAG: glycosyltransferase [Clostridia bacterium]|nr:glycosyltransferase [Clostridia bacterium]